ncbi:MAG: hypothetical protein P8163_03520 [Candidatus Thiodiazotropha sp.]
MIVFSDFQPLLNDKFEVDITGKRYPITLTRIEILGAPYKKGARQPFSLTFCADAALGILRQSVYPMTHDSFGKCSIFLIPRGIIEDKCYYEAIYN